MRSSPPLQLALVLLGFLCLAWPLIRLTSASVPEQAAVVASPAEGNKLHTLVTVRYAHLPSRLVLKHGEQILLQLKPDSGAQAEAQLPFAKEGLELTLSAQWPEGTPDTAITVELEPDGLDVQSQTRWSTGGSLEEVLLFSGPKS
jgi:hypothetical protein